MCELNGNRILLTVVGIMAAIVLGSGNAKADFIFGEPTNAGPPLCSTDYTLSCFSSDGLEMYLTSTWSGSDNADRRDLWVVKRETIDDNWGSPTNLGPLVNSSEHDQTASISSDGLELYFASYRTDGYGRTDIWVTRRPTRSADWGMAENLGPVVNSSEHDAGPRISSDGLELYFSSGRPDIFGWSDILVSSRETTNDPWGEPVNLGAVVNTSSSESAPSISPDGLALFFESNRPGGCGGPDLWMTVRTTVNDPWGTPMNLGPTVNSPPNQQTSQHQPTLSADGLTLYFVSQGTSAWDHRAYYQVPIIPLVDFNSDEIIDLVDLVMLIDNWGTDDKLYDIGPMPWGDGVVDEADLEVLMASWDQAVDFTYDPKFASDPRPSDGSTMDVDEDISLSWIPGQDAVEHDVYLGTDLTSVKEADISDTSGVYRGRLDASEYTTTEALELGQTFFWRVDGVNPEGIISKGKLWSFTVADVVDNFESYTDDVDYTTFEGTTIFNTWIDAYFVWNNGGIVGYISPPFAEVCIVHGGLQAMPFFYDNDGTLFEGEDDEVTGVPYYSETQRTWDEPQDWTKRDVEVLTLWLYGEPDNAADPFYIGLEDSAGNRKDITHPDLTVLTVNDWQQWSIPLADFTDVDLAAIKVMYIGVGDPADNQPGGSGLVRIDDIELHIPATP